MGRGNIQIPGAMPQPPMGIMVAQPMNDLQVVMLVAAALPAGTAKERVALALDILEEAVDQQFELSRRIMRANVLSKKRDELEQRASQDREEKPPDDPRGILIAG